jgi:hypothetical protein
MRKYSYIVHDPCNVRVPVEDWRRCIDVKIPTMIFSNHVGDDPHRAEMQVIGPRFGTLAYLSLDLTELSRLRQAISNQIARIDGRVPFKVIK